MPLPAGRRRGVLLLAAASVVTVGAGVAVGAPSSSATTTVLRGDVLPGLSHATPLGATAPGRQMEIGVTLARPDPAGEQAAYRAIYTPGSPRYHHFFTPVDYAARFAVRRSAYDAVTRWATRDGLSVARTQPMRDYLLLTGSAAQVQKTFSVRLRDFRYGGRTFYANANAPTVPAGLGVAGVLGLNSYLRSHTFHTRPSADAPHGKAPAQDTCTGECIGLTTPQDLWSVYDQPTDNTGQGQTMAIFGEGQTDPVIKNLRTFENVHKLPQVPITVVHADGPNADYSDNSGEIEWDLDTQSSTGMAPNVLGETLYFGKDLSDASVLNVFSTWANDPNGPLQASASYGECEENPLGDTLAPLNGKPGWAGSAGQEFTAASEAALLQADNEGRTLFASTGDTGSSCPLVYDPIVGLGAGNGVANQAFPVVNYPASSPHVVAVGGTVLYTDGKGADQTGLTPSGASRQLEYGWTYTGGGTSITFAQPSYQQNVVPFPGTCLYGPGGDTSGAGGPCRGIPDIAAQSGDIISNGYAIVAQGDTAFPGGGTSLSSPLSLGMWTRIQAAAPAGGLGFADETYYADFAENPGDFFDIGGGQTSPPDTNGSYPSTPGWDYMSGLGVPDVTKVMLSVDGTTTPTNNVLPPAGGGGSTSTLNPCSPTLFTDPTGDDAYVGDPNGSGSNPQLDIVSGTVSLTPDGTALHTVITIANLSTDTAQAAGAANEYYLLWTFKDTQYFSNVEVDTTTGDIAYGDGTVSGNTYSTANTDTGTFNPGKDGTVTVDVPLGNVGNPAIGDILTAPAAQTRVLAGTTATGGFIEPADSADPTYDYQLGASCTTTTGPGKGKGKGKGHGHGKPSQHSLVGSAPSRTV